VAFRARVAPLKPDREDWPYHSVKSLSLPVNALFGGDRRMEAENYLLSGYGIRAAIEDRKGWVRLHRYVDISLPSRTKGILVSPEYGTPFLAATQVFDVRPVPRKWLAPGRISHAASLFVNAGTILVTRSGTVGRATLAYTPHLETLISDDLLRVEARDKKHWGWIYAYLRSPTARAMMTSAQYGHMIKHLEVSHLNALPLPELSDPQLDYFTQQTKAILDLRERAHAATLEAEQRFADCLGPLPAHTSGETGFVVNAGDAFFGRQRRIDGWPHNPRVRAITEHLASRGRDVVTVSRCGYRVWVPGRYKRVPADEGVIFLDSSDLFEINPDLPKRYADCAFGDEYQGRVEKGWLLMASSGQTYGIVGGVVLANTYYEDKVLANHVIRIAPQAEPAVRPGYLLTALSHPVFGRPVMKSFAFGSSVPEIGPNNVSAFKVVRLEPNDEDYIADCAEQAAELRAQADLLETAIADEADSILSHFMAGDVMLPSHSAEKAGRGDDHVPDVAARHDSTDDYWDRQNTRRVFLIKKELHEELVPAEQDELNRLQAEMGEYLDAAHPLPFEELERRERYVDEAERRLRGLS